MTQDLSHKTEPAWLALHTYQNLDASHEGERQAWMVSFADLMALLLTLMVVIFSTRQIDPVGWHEMSGSLQGLLVVQAQNGDAQGTPDGAVKSETAVRSGQYADRRFAAQLGDALPDLAASGAVVQTPAGLELNLGAQGGNAALLAKLGTLLGASNRPLTVSVVSPTPSRTPSAIQRVLAWEEGIARALALKTRIENELIEGGASVDIQVGISVTLAHEENVIILIGTSPGVSL